MRSQTITLTPLPNGRTTDGRLRLSVHIAPRLESDEDGTHPVLSAFPDFADWARRAARASFTVGFGGDNGVVTTSVDAVLDEPVEPDGDLWEAIFPLSCEVKPFTFTSFAGQKLRSFPAANVHTYLSSLYASFGLSDPLHFPTATALLAGSALGSFASDPSDRVREQLHQAVEDMISGSDVIRPVSYSPDAVATDLTQVEILHRPFPKGTARTRPSHRPDFDFHKGVGSLVAHPQLLRRLGLVRDLLVAVPLGYTSATEVTIRFAGSDFLDYPINADAPHRTRVISVRTRYRATTFTAAPRTTNPTLFARRLNLSDPRKFTVTDLDLDGAALKLLGAASTINRSVKEGIASPLTSSAHPLPAMRSEGLALLQTGRAAIFQLDMGRQKGHWDHLKVGQAPVFDAEDLVRGHYLDIWDDTAGRWSPLGMRHVTYTPVGAPPFEVDDEGAVTMAVTIAKTEGDTDPAPDVNVPELMAKWSGWSVVAPRPGRALAKNNEDGMVLKTDTSDETGIKIGIRTTVPLPTSDRPKLPTLRYGRAYRFRARAADIAGNSEPFSDVNGDNRAATALTVYSRYEPVPHPIVLKHEDPTGGDSVLRLVIRSDYDQPAGNATPTYRHLVPPVASQLVVEQSGVLDTASGGRLDPGSYETLRRRDGQKLDNPDANSSYPDPTSPSTDLGSPELIFPADYVNVVHLPDPFSRGAVFYGLPFGTTNVGGFKPEGGTAKLEWLLDESDGWDTVRANRIRLAEPRTVTQAAHYSHKVVTSTTGRNKELQVFLPKATVVRARLSSFLSMTGSGPASDVDRMGIWRWLLAGATAEGMSQNDRGNLKKLVAAGGHWMISPSVEVVLVHAVRHPLIPPGFATAPNSKRTDADGYEEQGTFAVVDGGRGAGETALDWSGNLTISGRSTARVNLIANWKEDIDDGSLPAHGLVDFHAQPCSFTYDSDDHKEFPVAANGRPTRIVADTVRAQGFHELHDTKHRMITYTLEGISRFGEEFTETKEVTFPGDRTLEVATEEIVAGYTTLSSVDGGTSYQEGRDFTINDPTFGSITLAPEGPPDGERLRLRMLTGSISRFSTEPTTQSESTSTTVNVLSTARPKAPEIEYVVPAYEWTGWQTKSGAVTNTRLGNTIRVWLARPWFSSGDGEKLAVICPARPTNTTPQPDAMDPYHDQVSLIGMDPIWGDKAWAGNNSSGGAISDAQGIPTQTMLLPTDFLDAVRTYKDGVTIPGAVGSFGAAVHKVEFDRDRGLWYSDITIRSGVGGSPYTPFVQLALARFQVNSLYSDSKTAPIDLRTSAVVLAELIQLSPDRTLTIKRSTGVFGKITSIQMSGASYRADAAIDKLDADSNSYVGSDKGGTRLEIQCQTARAELNPTTFPDTGWTNVTQIVNDRRVDLPPTLLYGLVDKTGGATWTWKNPVLPTARPLRLVFTEYEDYDGPQRGGRVVFTATYEL